MLSQQPCRNDHDQDDASRERPPHFFLNSFAGSNSGSGVKPSRFGILTFGKTKMSGERIYAEEELLKIMFAPVWDELEPIYP